MKLQTTCAVEAESTRRTKKQREQTRKAEKKKIKQIQVSFASHAKYASNPHPLSQPCRNEEKLATKRSVFILKAWQKISFWYSGKKQERKRKFEGISLLPSQAEQETMERVNNGDKVS